MTDPDSRAQFDRERALLARAFAEERNHFACLTPIAGAYSS
jgi:hypothetical protein